MSRNLKEAEEKIHPAQTIIEKIDALNDQANKLLYTDVTQASHLTGEALALSEQEDYLDGKATALYLQAWCDYITGKYPSALQLAHESIAVSEKTGSQKTLASALNAIGSVLHASADYNTAREYFLRALEIREAIGDLAGQASCLSNIGNTYMSTSNLAPALDYYLKALAIREQVGDEQGQAHSLITISVFYSKSENFSKAFEYSRKALAISERIGSKLMEAHALGEISALYIKTGEHRDALVYQKKSLAILEELGEIRSIALSMARFGNILERTHDISGALEYFLRALAIHEEIGDKNGIAEDLHNIGRLFKTPGSEGFDLQKSITYLNRALALTEETGTKELGFMTHEQLGEAYEMVEDWKQSQIHFRKYHQLEKEVFNEATLNKIQNLETQQKLELIEKEREIERRDQKTTYKILNNIFPRSIVDRLRDGESPLADYYKEVSILFLDIVNFTHLSLQIPSRQLLYLLNSIFDLCDEIVIAHGLEKIKTIGDAYMAASGVPQQNELHLENAARAALALLKALKELVVRIPAEIEGDRAWMKNVGEIQVRLGLHCGEVTGGVIGRIKYAYDLWGDTVNTAARMETTGEPDMIHCSKAVYELLKDTFTFKERGELDIKGKGTMQTYFLLKENL